MLLVTWGVDLSKGKQFHGKPIRVYELYIVYRTEKSISRSCYFSLITFVIQQLSQNLYSVAVGGLFVYEIDTNIK